MGHHPGNVQTYPAIRNTQLSHSKWSFIWVEDQQIAKYNLRVI